MFFGRLLSRVLPLVALLALLSAGCGKSEPSAIKPAPTTADEKLPATGVAVSTSKKVSTKPKIDTPPEKFDLARAKPDFSLDAKEWVDEWQDDKAAAQMKYKGKVILLEGEVESCSLIKRQGSQETPACIFLKTGTLPQSRVMAVMQEKEPWAKVSAGSKVKIKGLVEREGPDLESPCVLASAEPNPAIVISSEQLGNAVASNADSAEEKYDRKPLIIIGIISEIELVGKTFRVKLKNEAKIDIVCEFAPLVGDPGDAGILLRSAKAGQRVKLAGKASVFDSVKLRDALPITDGK